MRLAYEGGYLRGPGLNFLQRWALSYHLVVQLRDRVEDSERNTQHMTLAFAPERFREMYLDSADSERVNLADGEENVTADQIDDIDAWLRSTSAQREISAAQLPQHDEWSEWA